jgi:cell division protein FtsW
MVKNFGMDRLLIALVAILVMFGLIMIYSSTMILAKEKYDDSFYFLKKQLLWLIIAIVIFLSISFLKQPIYLNQKIVAAVLLASIFSLILVFFMGKINGCYRWIRIAGLSVQPSEFAKIVVVLYLSSFLGRKECDVNNIKKLLVQLIPVFVIALLILKEPDYGTFTLVLLVAAIVLFAAGLKIRYFIYSSIFVIPFFISLIKMSPERINRVLAFLNPEAYASTYSFQTLQSIYAIGSGGIFGQGLGNSTQKLYFLPYAYTDFIYAVIGEEVGLIGCLAVLAIFLLFLIRSLSIAKLSGSRHTYLLVVGLSFLIFVQAMINISVSLGIFPTKGMPLPFISSGGSSLISGLIIAGIIINVSKHRKMVLLND